MILIPTELSLAVRKSTGTTGPRWESGLEFRGRLREDLEIGGLQYVVVQLVEGVPPIHGTE